MRGGVGCSAAVTDRHAESADQRLQRQRAQRPAQLRSHKLEKYFKKKGESLHCPQKTGRQSQRRRKRIKRFGEERG